MPKQVHHLLLSLKENEIFQSRRHQAIVLMSDMAGYTSMTGILKEPSLILELMNDYLGETSFVLQTKYEGWLETYLGDMVCYYWPFTEKNRSAAYRNALMGALELSQLQKRFFSEVEERYKNKFDVSALHDIRLIVDAGIGLSAGEVVMGDLGPKQGVRKFGILGDPMNLTARIESLTRHFNAEIIVTEDFCWAAHNLGFPHRRLGLFCVKGRKQPVTLYAVGSPDDPRFEKSRVEAWENWLIAMETQAGSNGTCPEIFIKDQMSLTKWMGRGLLQKGIWQLDEK